MPRFSSARRDESAGFTKIASRFLRRSRTNGQIIIALVKTTGEKRLSLWHHPGSSFAQPLPRLALPRRRHKFFQRNFKAASKLNYTALRGLETGCRVFSVKPRCFCICTTMVERIGWKFTDFHWGMKRVTLFDGKLYFTEIFATVSYASNVDWNSGRLEFLFSGKTFVNSLFINS